MNSTSLFDNFITQLKTEVADTAANAVSGVLVKEKQKHLAKPMTDILTIDEAAEFLNIKKKTLYTWVSNLEIPFYKVKGRSVRFSMKELENWVQTFRVKTTKELQSDAETELLLSTRRRE